MTSLRKEKYESSGLMDNDPVTIRKVKELEKALEKPVTLDFSGGIVPQGIPGVHHRPL